MRGARIRFPPDVLSVNERDLMRSLLNRNPNLRLGAINGIQELKSHLFFDEIDWVKLRRREIMPPVRPMLTKTLIPDYDSGRSEHQRKDLAKSSHDP